jgi:hypothetical protein
MSKWIHYPTQAPTIRLILDRVHLLSSGGHRSACNRLRFVNDQRKPHGRSVAERLWAEVGMLHRFVGDKEAITTNL